MPRMSCQWCGWVNGEHASACDWRKFMSGAVDRLDWFPGANEAPAQQEYQPAMWLESPVKLDCPE